jgi:hypothetical protein
MDDLNQHLELRLACRLRSPESLVYGYRLATRRMGKIYEPCLPHAQQQLRQESGGNNVVPCAIACAAPAKPRLGRGIRIPFLERVHVQRQDFLRDHRDRGQRHAQAGHEADKSCCCAGAGLRCALPEFVCDERRGGGAGAACAWVASRVLSFSTSVR